MESTQHHLDHDTARTQSYLAPCTAPDRDVRTSDGHATTWVTNQRHTARGAFPEQGLSQPAKELTSCDVATARKTVLLAEDDAALRLLFTLRLEQAGFDVLVAADGREALRLWTSAQPPPMVLVVTDWSMPSIDGLELVRRMRSEAVTDAPVPIVLLSAHPSPPSEDLAELNLHYRSKTTPWTEIEPFLQALVAP